MIGKPFALVALAMALVIPISCPSRGAQVRAPGIDAGNGPIICSVMEAFDEGKLGVRAIIFHQRDKADGPAWEPCFWRTRAKRWSWRRLAGQHYRATVFRVKSAFGRGLVLVPTSQLKLGAHDEFTLRLPGKN